jgi:flagella basal body P-ring formation protein FlgA
MILTLIACSLAAPLMTSALVSAGSAVVLRADAQVAGPTVELSEIADVRADSPDDARRIGMISLGASPMPGALRNVTRDEIVRALRAAGIESTIGGTSACRARSRVDVVAGRDFEAAARTALATLLAGHDAEIAAARPASDVAALAPEHKRDLAVDLSRAEPRSGPWSVPVDLVVDGARVETVWIAMDVRLFERVPVAAHAMKRGDAFDDGAWTLERVPLESSSPLAANARSLAGATSARDLARGARIVEADVHKEPLVRNGDEIELEVVRGVIRARTLAVARGTGALNDRVEVQSGGRERRLTGVVVARGIVRVELSEPTNSRPNAR